MFVRETTPPAQEPLPLGEAKAHLRVEHEDEDGEIKRKIVSAREWCEEYVGRVFITRTFTGYRDNFPRCGRTLIQLPHPPASEIVSVKYYDADGIEQTLDPATYQFDDKSEPGRIRPIVGESWPATEDRLSAVEIVWKAGFGPNPSDVSEKIKSAIKLALSDLYEQRETIVLGLNANTTNAIEIILGIDRFTESID